MRSGTAEELKTMIQRLQDGASRLFDSVIELIYHMNGGVTYFEAMELTPGERSRIISFLERHYELKAKANREAGRKH